MKYVLLFCGTPDDVVQFDALAPEAVQQQYANVWRWFTDNQSRIRASERLQPETTATTVRHGWNGDEPMVTDGPFIEGKESIGGFAVIEVADLDEALRMARTWPGHGTVEIRPVADMRTEAAS